MCDTNVPNEISVDGFDLGQSDDECGDGYFNDSLNSLTPEDYADLFLENYQ